MPQKEIRKSIDELKRELERTSHESNGLKEMLEKAREEIERYTPEAVQDLLRQLQHEADEFEVEHPRITALINNVMTHLSNLGI